MPLSRLEEATQRASKLISKKLGKAKRQIEDGSVHVFDRGFGVGAWAGSKRSAIFAGVGVVDHVPTEATVEFDTDFFEGRAKGRDCEVLWVEVEVFSPVPEKYRIPLRGVGVLRDPESGHVLRAESFELATDLISDAGEVLKKILCILACVGLFCYAACSAACVAVVACIACLVACVGASLPQFLVCLKACGVAADEIEGAIT